MVNSLHSRSLEDNRSVVKDDLIYADEDVATGTSIAIYEMPYTVRELCQFVT